MLIPSDYRDLLSILNKHKVKYLIVGAYAVIYYTEPRYTKDIDIWIRPDIKNAEKAYAALREFGAPLKGIEIEDFSNKNLVYQVGIEPVRIDIIMGISDVEFDFAWKHRTVADFERIKINIIGINELIEAKKKTKRDMDARDVEVLRTKLKFKRRR